MLACVAVPACLSRTPPPSHTHVAVNLCRIAEGKTSGDKDSGAFLTAVRCARVDKRVVVG
jgi:hypothetical protein